MKKIAMILIPVILLTAAFTPIPTSYRDGGTTAYSALTYKIVNWNRIMGDQVLTDTCVYWFPDNFKSIDELWAQEEDNILHQFKATVLELQESSALLEPVDGVSCDRITVNTAPLEDIGAQVGATVKVSYTGGIMESYPAQVRAVKWELIQAPDPNVYYGQWLDKTTAQKRDDWAIEDIEITKIYDNCFFARYVIPSPYEIKLNGQLSDEWCVGDHVSCTHKNTYLDKKNFRLEADFLTVEPSDFELVPGQAYKPVIYLYPETEQRVSVKLHLDGELTCTYPAYQQGWDVTAAPDGTLKDSAGEIYNYLYWEGTANAQWNMDQGFCVKGTDTAVFLEDALKKLGLNRREANEFIVYWLPLMEANPYNVISFQTDAYTDAAKLDISPAPDTTIRVFMAWYSSTEPVSLPAQTLDTPQRKGFTAVEWGGTEIK